MQTSPQRFSYPKLRDGILYSRNGAEHHLDYRQQGVILFSDAEDASLDALITDLSTGGYTPSELKTKNPLLADEIDALIEQLDNHYLLTESHYAPVADTLSGTQFARKLKSYANAWHRQLGTSALYAAMQNGTATASQLIGFAIEYYHIVKAAPTVLAPALSQKCPPAVFQGIKHLFLEEHDHEGLLLKALGAAGLSEEQVSQTTPLPATFSVYATLGTFSRQHLLSFISSLFLFEEPYPEFNTVFVENCRRLGLPDAFWKPIIGHSEVNEEGGHHLITDELLSHISAISAEEAQVTLIHVMTLLETMKIWDSQICEYYQAATTLRIYQ